MNVTEQVTSMFDQVVEDRIKDAKLSIIVTEGCMPVFLYATEEGFQETTLDLEQMTTEEIAQLMKETCKDPKVLTAALVIDSFMKEIPRSELDSHPDVDLSKDPDSKQVLFTFVYTREGEKVRRITHATQPDGSPWFYDHEWETVNSNEATVGRFSNPFQAA